jgi:hypothetical protein
MGVWLVFYEVEKVMTGEVLALIEFAGMGIDFIF